MASRLRQAIISPPASKESGLFGSDDVIALRRHQCARVDLLNGLVVDSDACKATWPYQLEGMAFVGGAK